MDWQTAYNKGFTIKTSKPSKIINLVFPLLEKNQKQVLDIGSGEGRNSLFFANNNFKVDSIDLVDFKIKHKNINFKKIDVTKFIFKKKYDLIILSRVIQYFDLNVLNNLFKNIYDNLNVNSYVCISYSFLGGIHKNSTFNLLTYNYSKDFLKNKFKKIGFKIIYFRKGSNVSKHVPYKEKLTSYDVILKKIEK